MITAAKASTGALAVLAVAAFTAGCTSGSGSGSSGGGEAAPAVTKPAKDVVLTASELPTGFKAVPVTDAQLQSAVDQIAGVAANATIDPAECGSGTSVLAAKPDISKVGLIAATSDKGMISESVFAERADLGKLRKTYSGACKVMRSSATSAGQKVESTITTTVLESPSTKASDALVVEQATASSASGVKLDDKSYVGYATVGGYTVTVKSGGLLGTPDKATFDKIFTAAIDKVAKG